MAKKIITVFGATGKQGGGVVDTFLSDPKLTADWVVRGVTRDASKDSSKALAARGAEIVTADVNDKESLVKALAGSSAVFATTNYWETLDAQKEVQQGKNMADAAKEAGVDLFIWSSLLHITKLTNGVFSKVYHFDSKADVEEYIRSIGIPAAFFLPGFYMSNLNDAFNQTPPDNAWTLALITTINARFPLYHTGDTGKYVKAMVLNRDKVLGKHIYGASEYVTPQQILDGFKKAYPEAGKDARFYQLPHEKFLEIMTGAGLPFFAAEELLQNFRLMDEFGYYGGASLDETHALLEDKLTTWDEFVKGLPKFAELK